MSRLNLFKVILFFNATDAMKLVAVANKNLSEDKVKKMLVTELYGNYIIDHNMTWSKEALDDCVKNAVCERLGTLETKNMILKDTEDFAFVLLAK